MANHDHKKTPTFYHKNQSSPLCKNTGVHFALTKSCISNLKVVKDGKEIGDGSGTWCSLGQF